MTRSEACRLCIARTGGEATHWIDPEAQKNSAGAILLPLSKMYWLSAALRNAKANVLTEK